MIALFRCGEPGPTAMAAGGVLYVLGMFVVTMIFDVPLNSALSDGLDLVEPRADGLVHGGLRTVYCRDCGKVGRQRCRQTKAAGIGRLSNGFRRVRSGSRESAFIPLGRHSRSNSRQPALIAARERKVRDAPDPLYAAGHVSA